MSAKLHRKESILTAVICVYSTERMQKISILIFIPKEVPERTSDLIPLFARLKIVHLLVGRSKLSTPVSKKFQRQEGDIL
jgi:hypothetical protein